MPKRIKQQDARLFLRISTELKTKIQLESSAKNIPISIFVMEAIKKHLEINTTQ